MLITPVAAETAAAWIARATSLTSTKSRYPDRSGIRTWDSSRSSARRSPSASRPNSEAVGAPGPTTSNTLSTAASSPEASTSSVPASFETPYGPTGRGSALSDTGTPPGTGPYSAAEPTCTSRAGSRLRRIPSQTVATASVLARISVRELP